MKRLEKSVFTKEYKLFLSRLCQARKVAGLTQEKLANRLPHSQKFVSRCETGERRIDVIELRAFCRALDISFVEFARELDAMLEELEN